MDKNKTAIEKAAKEILEEKRATDLLKERQKIIEEATKIIAENEKLTSKSEKEETLESYLNNINNSQDFLSAQKFMKNNTMEDLNFYNNYLKKKSNIEKESSIEVEREKNKKEIKRLKKQIEDTRNITQEQLDEAQKTIKDFEDKNKELDTKLKKIQSSEEKIQKSIEFIDKFPSEHLQDLKTSLSERIDFFNKIGHRALIITFFTFFGYLGALIVELPIPKTSVAYFTNIFFIVFPTLVAFAALRQSNLKSKELEKIDEKLLNSKYLVGSLEAIQRISENNEEDILKSINKIIDSILKTSKEEEKEEKTWTTSELSTILKNVSSITK